VVWCGVVSNISWLVLYVHDAPTAKMEAPMKIVFFMEDAAKSLATARGGRQA
jgi:hypothetical protein